MKGGTRGENRIQFTTGYRLENSGTDEDTTRSVEHGPREMEEMASRITLERIVNRGNLYDAYQRVKANNGAPGIDNMTVKESRMVRRAWRGMDCKYPERNLQTTPCAASRNPEGQQRRKAKAWNTHC